MRNHITISFCLMTFGSVIAAPIPNRVDPKSGEERSFEIAPGVKMVFCWIPAGEAQLGSPKSERAIQMKEIMVEEELDWMKLEDEKVRGKYKTTGFWLGKYPVTQAEYDAVIKMNPSVFKPEHDYIKRSGILDTSRFPVDNVNWHDCQAYMKKLNDRTGMVTAFGKTGKFVLPHEDQWEYACRGGKGNERPFYWGNTLDGTQANADHTFSTDPEYKANNGRRMARTSEVGSYAKVAPHPWGLCDMSGNVMQWCENWYDKDQKLKVQRGGSWFGWAVGCRSACRIAGDPEFKYNTHGFRVCFVLD